MRGEQTVKAILEHHVIADSDDIVEEAGYRYFPRSAVRMEWLEKAPKTDSDRACPHGVQFYDVVIDGARHERAAWSYEAPQPRMQAVGGRFGFWEDVKVV
jgi:uncharacterized protein (DUF427 family)